MGDQTNHPVHRSIDRATDLENFLRNRHIGTEEILRLIKFDVWHDKFHNVAQTPNALEFLPNLELPKQNHADSGTTESKST